LGDLTWNDHVQTAKVWCYCLRLGLTFTVTVVFTISALFTVSV